MSLSGCCEEYFYNTTAISFYINWDKIVNLTFTLLGVYLLSNTAEKLSTTQSLCKEQKLMTKKGGNITISWRWKPMKLVSILLHSLIHLISTVILNYKFDIFSSLFVIYLVYSRNRNIYRKNCFFFRLMIRF